MASKIELARNDNLESAVYTLLAARARGEHVYCVFNGHELYSDTVSMDSAYLEVIGMTKTEKEQKDREWKESYDRKEELRKIREQGYVEKVMASRTQDKPITALEVVNGLKFIAENRSISQDELVDGLIKLGCNFTREDIQKQFPERIGKLDEGIKKGDISAGADIIVNMRDSEFGRSYGDNYLLSIDGESSIYHLIRAVTGDESYTKDNIDLSVGANIHR